MDTRTRGDIAEAAILHALTARGLLVLTPFGRFGPYDLVTDLPDGRFVRIQVKSGRMRNGCVEFNCRGTDHGNGPGSYAGRADVFAVHVHQTGQQYVVPVSEALESKMYLRVEPAVNNQRARVRRAEDYALSVWVESVVSRSSSPSTTTTSPAAS